MCYAITGRTVVTEFFISNSAVTSPANVDISTASSTAIPVNYFMYAIVHHRLCFACNMGFMVVRALHLER
jgi:hypothetical protein